MLSLLLALSLAVTPVAAVTLEALADSQGQVLSGRVSKVMEMGAFVDVGGVLGLVHVSDMGWTGEKDARKLVEVGQEVSVTVLSVDLEKQRLSLSMRRAEDSPWMRVPEKYPLGARVEATVLGPSTQLDSGIGLFVQLEPYVDALVHPLDLPKGKSGTDYPVGSTVQVRILKLDVARERVGAAIDGG
jgi:ribosomal protein S1